MRRLVAFALAATTILVLAASCILAIAKAAPPAQWRRDVLQPQDLLSMVQLTTFPSRSTAISPSGSWIAYVISVGNLKPRSTNFDPRGPGRKELWVVNVASSKSVRVGDPSADAWAPAWSPDGRFLAFYTARTGVGRLAIWSVATGRTQVTNEPVGVYPPQPAEWVSANRLIVPILTRDSIRELSGAPSGLPKPTPIPAITVFSSTPAPHTAAVTGDVITESVAAGEPAVNEVVYDLDTGSARVLARNLRVNVPPLLSPDRKRMAYLIDKGEIDSDVNDREIYDVIVTNVTTGATQKVASNILTSYNASTLSWSRNGMTLAFVGGRMPGDVNPTTSDSGSSFPGHLYLIDVAHPGNVRMLGTGLFSRFGGRVFWNMDDAAVFAVDEQMKFISEVSIPGGETRSVVSLASATFSYSDDLLYKAGAHIYAETISDDGERRISTVNLTSGAMRPVLHGYQDIGSLAFSSDGTRAAYISQNVRRPPDVWIAEDGFANLRQVTHLNPQVETRALGDAAGVHWMSTSGVPLEGTVLLPADYESGKRYPTITWIYGGEPEGTSDRVYFGLSFSGQAPYFNLQLLASRGYAVFVPDSILHVGTPMADLADDVFPGIDRLVAMGIADPNRLGLYGQSYGGYSTLALLVQSDRFKAAVAMSGVYDIFAMYGTMYDDGTDWTSWAESEQGRMGGTPWNQRQRYIDNSPFFFLDRVHTPVLLEYGSTDKAAMTDAEEAFVSLRRLGRTVELVRYADEGHVLMKRSNQIDLCNRIFAWFGKYLR